jgi:hypothetical protein
LEDQKVFVADILAQILQRQNADDEHFKGKERSAGD